jgi:surface antigen
MIEATKGGTASLFAMIPAALLLSICLATGAQASDSKTTQSSHAVAAKSAAAHAPIVKTVAVQPSSKHPQLKTSKAVYVERSYGMSCVPYARSVTGMDIKGNAKDWWSNAAGLYARGGRPESGAVMSFRDTPGMRLGHVAVVARVIDSRTVEIDHANWRGPGATKGNVFKSIPVIDVSENNDWSRVRVGLGHTGDFGGTVYPTNGFIYDRPDDGRATLQAAIATPARWQEAELIHREIQ